MKFNIKIKNEQLAGVLKKKQASKTVSAPEVVHEAHKESLSTQPQDVDTPYCAEPQEVLATKTSEPITSPSLEVREEIVATPIVAAIPQPLEPETISKSNPEVEVAPPSAQEEKKVLPRQPTPSHYDRGGYYNRSNQPSTAGKSAPSGEGYAGQGGGGYQGSRPAPQSGGGYGYQGSRPAPSQGGGYQGQSSQGYRGGYQGQSSQGYQGSRPAPSQGGGYQAQSSGYQGSRPAPSQGGAGYPQQGSGGSSGYQGSRRDSGGYSRPPGQGGGYSSSGSSYSRPMQPRPGEAPRPRSFASNSRLGSLPTARPFVGNTSPKPEVRPSGFSTPKKVGRDDFGKGRDAKDASRSLRKGGPVRGFDVRDRAGLGVDGDDGVWRKKRANNRGRSFYEQEEIIRPRSLKIRLPITLKDLAAEMKLKAAELVAKLFMRGLTCTLNEYLIDEMVVHLLGQDFGCEITFDTQEEDRLRITDKTIREEILAITPELCHPRPPVIALMGHVDHGKTSLLDAIRESNRVAGEAGAITQHIGAFCCHSPWGALTVLDTPGHAAFSSMRARGAEVTDIVVLVVAGDDGIKAQTIEAIEQSRKANVPIVVAITKSDKPDFDTEVVYRQLAEQNLLPEAWGGTTITVSCSAKQKEGVNELLQMLLLQSSLMDLRANPSGRARGTVIESALHKGLGAVATVLVQNGTLRVGDPVVFAQHYAKIKTMYDEWGNEVAEAPPSTPVKITGLSGVPEAGSEFIVVESEKEARAIAEKRSEGTRADRLHQKTKLTAESFLRDTPKAEKKQLNLLIRADVQGSAEALKASLQNIETNKVDLVFLVVGVGEISESDVSLASSSGAVILGFHAPLASHAEPLMRANKVKVLLHDVIYRAVEDVQTLMIQSLDKIVKEVPSGELRVVAIFKSTKHGTILGGTVIEGLIRRDQKAKLLRAGKEIWSGTIASLKRNKDDAKEVSKGFECGVLLSNSEEGAPEDIIKTFDTQYLTQTL